MSNYPDSPETWLRNFRPHINGERVSWLSYHLSLVAGGTVVLTMEYEFSPLIGTPQGVIALQCEPGIDVTGIKISPPPGQLIEMVAGSKSLSWEIATDDAKNGEFYIYFTLPNYPVVSDSPHLSGEIFDVPWSNGFTFLVNDKEVILADLYLPVVDRGVCKLTLNYDGSALSGKQGAAVALEFKPGGEVVGLDTDKPLGELVALEEGQKLINWYISSRADALNSPFELQLGMPEIFGMPASPPLQGSIVNNVWDQFSAWFNGVEVSMNELWFYVVNGETVTLKLDFGSSALPNMPGAAVSLGFEPGREVSGLIVTPELGQPVLMEGLKSVTWDISLKSDAINEPFGLSWSIRGVSDVPASPTMSGNIFNEIWKEFVLAVNGVQTGLEKPWIPVIDERPSLLSVNCEKSSVRGLKDASLVLEWKYGAKVEGMLLNPEAGDLVPVEASTKFLNWFFSVAPEAKSVPFEMYLHIPAFDRVPKYALNGHAYNKVWERNFKVYVDNVEVEWDSLTLPMRVGKRCTLMLDAEGAWLTDDPNSLISLEYESEKGEVLSSSPPFGEPLKIVEGADPLTWTITVNPLKHGTFKLFFKIHQPKGVPVSPKIPGSVIDFSKEIEVLFDRYPFTFSSDKNAYPCRGAEHEITIIPEPSSALLGKMAMFIWSGTPAETLGISMDLGPKLLTQQGTKFELNCTNALADGLFALQLCVPEFEQMSQPLSFSLGHNLVTATRWTDPWPTPPGFADFIRATSVFLNTGAPGVQVQVTFRGETYFRKIQSSGTYGEIYSEPPGYTFLIKNLYDGSEV